MQKVKVACNAWQEKLIINKNLLSFVQTTKLNKDLQIFTFFTYFEWQIDKQQFLGKYRA